MGLFDKLDTSCKGTPHIDWDITPALTFTIFESWGTTLHVRDKDARYYYFYVDNWQTPPELRLMERGIKYAKVLARIKAPRHLIDGCIASQGEKSTIDKAYAIDAPLRQWLMENIIDNYDDSLVIPQPSDSGGGFSLEMLPPPGAALPDNLEKVILPAGKDLISEADAMEAAGKFNFFERKWNPNGMFPNYFVNSGNGFTVTDLVTGIMWQAGGCDIVSINGMGKYIEKANRERFAGHDDWRLPGLEEALSLLEPGKNAKGLHLHPCFSSEQSFIFVRSKHVPGGHWFVDFTSASAFYASGHNPGGFGRLCRAGGNPR